jgi:hypothetical protein
VLAIRFAVVRTRHQGRKLADHELQRQEPAIGELNCHAFDDPYLHRSIRVVKLLELTGNAIRSEVIPALYDAEIVNLGGRGALITGIERVQSAAGTVEYAQSWWVRFI